MASVGAPFLLTLRARREWGCPATRMAPASTRTAVLLLSLVAQVAQATPLSAAVVVTRKDCLRGALLFGAGDVVAQRLEGSANAERLLQATSLGTVYGGLIITSAYQFAESLFPGRRPASIVLKTAVSCAMLSIGGNFFSLTMRRLLSPSGALDGESFAARLCRTVADVASIFPNVLRDDLRVWPLYDLLCFSAIPPSLRPTATACVSVCWQTYMSLVANRKGDHDVVCS